MTLTAFYDLEFGPVSFDFVTFLVRAMMERDRRGCDGLHVVVVPHEAGLGGFSRHWGPHDEAATRWRLWHIVVAACPLAGATVTLAATREQARKMSYRAEHSWAPEGKAHLAAPIMDAARKGTPVPRLAATEAARRYVDAWLVREGRKVVTLTMRRQSNDPARNADRAAWLALAAWLEKVGYCVVTLDDAHDALCKGRGYVELDVDLRLALYERAAMNVVGNNGLAALLWHSAAPYLRVAAGLPAEWKANIGLAQGEQIPWATRDQVLMYAPDTFEAMRAALTDWENAKP
ncbi:MAG: hypothetical protein U1A72_15545 [Sulfuritalea sp.]|nr:hypothetical protein [Sulfuritalea sp.]